jgi:fatty acid desaturase
MEHVIADSHVWAKPSHSRSDPRMVATDLAATIGIRRIDHLCRTDNYTNLVYLGADWLVIAGATYASLALDGVITYLLAIVVIASRQRALMNLVHQASHNQLFRNKKINRLFGRMTAMPLLICMDVYKADHLAHHRSLWTKEDPEAQRYARRQLDRRTTARTLAVRHGIGALTLAHLPSSLVASLAWSHEGKRSQLAHLGFWGGAVVVAYLTGTASVVLLYWVVPHLTVFQVLRYWMEAVEHAGLRSDDPWTASRNWTSAAPVQWLLAPHSDSYHLAHHIVPGVPHYRLTTLHRELMSIPEYVRGHQCSGLLIRRALGTPSVLEDICQP